METESVHIPAVPSGTPAAARLPTSAGPRAAWVVNFGIVLLIALMYPLNAALVHYLDPYFLLIVVLAGINIIAATSLNLINGITGQFSLGHAGFMAIGGYTAGILIRYYNPEGWHAPLAVVGVLVLGGVLAAVAGLIIGIPTLRLRGDYLAIATLGFGEIIRVVLTNTDRLGPFDVGGASGLHGIPILVDFFWAYAAAIVCVVCLWRLVHCAKGKAFLAVREDEIAAAATGVDTTFYKVLAFVIGAFFAGVAGGLTALYLSNLDPAGFGFMASINYVVMVVLGGSGSITGSILAAVLLTILPEGLRYVKDWTHYDFRMVIYSLALIVMMLVRPEGLLGRRELWRARRRTPPAAT